MDNSIIEQEDLSFTSTASLIQRCTPGTHLVTPRFGYCHHGVYTGNGKVIHYAGLCTGFRIGPVEEVPIDEFSNGQPVYEVPHPDAKYVGEQVVRRARSRLGENRYRLWTNNCEHLCSWSIDGISHSTQVTAITATAIQLLDNLTVSLHLFAHAFKRHTSRAAAVLAKLAAQLIPLFATTHNMDVKH